MSTRPDEARACFQAAVRALEMVEQCAEHLRDIDADLQCRLLEIRLQRLVDELAAAPPVDRAVAEKGSN